MDLNVIVENCGPRDSDQIIKQKLARCKVLGFEAVALSVTIEIKDEKFEVPLPPDVEGLSSSQFKVYTRLTAKVSETIQIYKLNKSKETAKYDLLALEPQNAKILQYISSGSADLDILTFNLSQRMDYTLFKTAFRVLEERGVCIEINYGPAQLGSSLRRHTICNGQNLTEKTSKNIILSSGVNDIFRLRGPKDATSVGVLFLMAPNKCHEAVFKNGTKAINHAKHRANPASSAIELVQ